MDNDLVEKYRTLGIIALIVIIALLIITSFVNLKEKKDYSYKSKVFFADLSQAVQYSVSYNGLPGQWGFVDDSDNSSIVDSFLLSGIRLSKKCFDKQKDCFYNGNYKNLRGIHTVVKPSVFPSVVMKNGINIAFESKGQCSNNNDVCLVIYVDLNGVNPPNMLGKDLLVFELLNSESTQFRPWGSSMGFSNAINDKSFGCSKSSRTPFACAALLFSKNWRYDKSYPW